MQGEGFSKEEYIRYLDWNPEHVDQIIAFADSMTLPSIYDYINEELLTNEIIKVFGGGGSDVSAMRAAKQYYIDNDLPVPIELKDVDLKSVSTDFSFFDTLIFNTYAVVRGSIGIIIGDWGPRFNPVPVSEFINYCKQLPWVEYLQFNTIIDLLCHLDSQLSVPINKEISRKMEKK